ncbi:MAG: ROK family protein [Woeseiaceae bacterium]|nr:ROK family protein [Woeseiaceae bacterium]
MRLGIDLGGTKIEILALNEAGEELLCKRVATPRENYSATLDSIRDLILSAESDLGEVCTVGIGTPGSPSPATGLMRNCNSTWLNGQPFKQDMEGLLGREIRISNDANCFALSEATDGAGADAETVFGVIIGTGCGGGIVVNNKLVDGPNACGGEWGHNSLPWPVESELQSTQCWCGLSGCIETFLSGTGLADDYEREFRHRAGAPEIIRAADGGDENAETIVRRYESRLARSLAQIINTIDPDVIVLGGGMSNVERLYKSVPAIWSDYVFSDTAVTPLLAPRFGDSSGVRGAAWLWD